MTMMLALSDDCYQVGSFVMNIIVWRVQSN